MVTLLTFPVTAVEHDCDGCYTYQTTIDIGLTGLSSGLACDIRNGGYMADNYSPLYRMGDRVNLNDGDIEKNSLMFTINGELFTVANSSPITGQHWNIGLDALDRFAKVLCNA